MTPLADYFRANPDVRKFALAQRLGVTPGRITQLCRGEKPSPELAKAIEAETGIPRWKLLPDIWDAPDDAGQERRA